MLSSARLAQSNSVENSKDTKSLGSENPATYAFSPILLKPAEGDRAQQ